MKHNDQPGNEQDPFIARTFRLRKTDLDKLGSIKVNLTTKWCIQQVKGYTDALC